MCSLSPSAGAFYRYRPGGEGGGRVQKTLEGMRFENNCWVLTPWQSPWLKIPAGRQTFAPAELKFPCFVEWPQRWPRESFHQPQISSPWGRGEYSSHAVGGKNQETCFLILWIVFLSDLRYAYLRSINKEEDPGIFHTEISSPLAFAFPTWF